MTEKKKTAKKRAKQSWIEGTKPETDEKLSALAEQLYDVRSERMQLTRQEVELADQLIEAMREREIDQYHDPDHGIDVQLQRGGDKVKLKKKSDGDPDDDA